MKTDARLLLVSGALGAALFAGGAQAQCVGAGVITRIDGQPQDVAIDRGGSEVSRIRVLEVLCEGDRVEVRGPATVTLSIGSSGPVQLRQGGSFTVHGASSRPSLASNAYLSVTDNVLKDMKRQPWEVRLRGGEPPLSFGVEGLTAGGQQALAGQRDLLVRMVGGRPGYTVTLSGPGGVVATGSGDASGEVLLRGADLAPGSYSLEGRDAAGTVVRGGFAVAGQPAVSSAYDGIDDAEVRAAVAAADLARTAPAWSFESEQMLNAAPRASLDRASVYRLIESYSAGA